MQIAIQEGVNKILADYRRNLRYERMKIEWELRDCPDENRRALLNIKLQGIRHELALLKPQKDSVHQFCGEPKLPPEK